MKCFRCKGKVVTVKRVAFILAKDLNGEPIGAKRTLLSQECSACGAFMEAEVLK